MKDKYKKITKYKTFNFTIKGTTPFELLFMPLKLIYWGFIGLLLSPLILAIHYGEREVYYEKIKSKSIKSKRGGKK